MIFANFWVLQVSHFKSREIARPILSLVSRETRDHLPTLVLSLYSFLTSFLSTELNDLHGFKSQMSNFFL